MVGDGDQKQEAVNLAASLGLEKRITFVPFRQDVPDFLYNADVYVLPSLWEGMPIGLIEAMAMGKAVLASNVDGTKELINQGENGMLMDKDHLETELVDMLTTIANEPGIRESLGKKAVSAIRDDFDVNVMSKKIGELYNTIKVPNS